MACTFSINKKNHIQTYYSPNVVLNLEGFEIIIVVIVADDQKRKKYYNKYILYMGKVA